MLQRKKSKGKLTKEVLGKRFNDFLASFSDDGEEDDSQASIEEEFQSLEESEIRNKLNSTILL